MRLALCIGLLSLLTVQTSFAQGTDSGAEPAASDFTPIHHNLRVTLDPENNRLEVTDTIDLPERFGRGHIVFALNTNLHSTNHSRGLRATGLSVQILAYVINETGGIVATTKLS